MSAETRAKLEQAIAAHLADEQPDDQPMLTEWAVAYSYMHGTEDVPTFSTGVVSHLHGSPASVVGVLEMARLDVLENMGYGGQL